MIRALVLFSGGLDSLLACKTLSEQGIEVVPVFFETYFFKATKARQIAEANNLKLQVADLAEEHLQVVKHPCHGRGSAFNPCLDCHALMLEKAGEMMKAGDSNPPTIPRQARDKLLIRGADRFRASRNDNRFDFIATGEVLGQRPMSQNKNALRCVEKEADLEGYLLRPLSAKLLPETIPEKKGLVDRTKLLDISGRGRKRQLELVKKLGIKKYQTPAGGCLLTEKIYAERLKQLLEKWGDFSGNDAELIRSGRMFWEGNCLILVGRNQEDNERLLASVSANDYIVELEDCPGPVTVVRGKGISQKTLNKAEELIRFYATKAKGRKEVRISHRVME